MGLLDGTTQNAYYQQGEKGGYQFTSLEDIVNYFMVVYVGEGKTISKVSKTDVAFHAQRAMQELSFDTFKSIKSQEITLPPSNTMMLPHDYVNYTKLSWSDSAGIKRPLYPTSNTSNPFKIKQDDDLNYSFDLESSPSILIPNGDFESAIDPLNNWVRSQHNTGLGDNISIVNGQLEFLHNGLANRPVNFLYAAWQVLDVTDMNSISLTAKGLSAAAGLGHGGGTVRVGLSTSPNFNQISITEGYDPNIVHPQAPVGNESRNGNSDIYNLTTFEGDLSYMEFADGLGTLSEKTVTEINVVGLTSVYLLITSTSNHTERKADSVSATNAVDSITLQSDGMSVKLISDGDSTTWTNYKSHNPNNNVNPETYSHDTDTYDFNMGERYGIDPQHAQVNGSYYIDNLRGLINFSSNVSGKTVILDYISDSLGTDGEMQVHKFAEEAMYKWIMYAVLSTRANTPEYIVRRYQKEKFAATRTAKLRLSNIKLEELTQILRGKSKWIKH